MIFHTLHTCVGRGGGAARPQLNAPTVPFTFTGEKKEWRGALLQTLSPLGTHQTTKGTMSEEKESSIDKKYLTEAPDWVAPKDRLSFTESFSQWLDNRNDSLPEPESFSAWLQQNDDRIEEDR